MSIIKHEYNGLHIPQRPTDGYIDATAMTKAQQVQEGKRRDVSDWVRLKRTQETLIHLSGVTGIPVTELVQVFKGGDPEKQGTWIHPRLAVRFATWLSDDFGYLVETWVAQWMTTGQNPVAVASVTIDQKPELTAARDIAEIHQLTDRLSPRIAQFLIDSYLNRQFPALPGDSVRWAGVVEIAEELGLPVNDKNRSKLGKFVKAIVGNLAREETRLCNGTMRPIAVYPVTDAVVDAVRSYFA